MSASTAADEARTQTIGLMLSSPSRVRVLSVLAAGTSLDAATIATRAGLKPGTAAQILRMLRSAGLLRNTRGAAGEYIYSIDKAEARVVVAAVAMALNVDLPSMGGVQDAGL